MSAQEEKRDFIPSAYKRQLTESLARLAAARSAAAERYEAAKRAPAP